MENYNRYISEINRLEIKSGKRFPDLSHFNVIKNRPPEELKYLMIYALGDLELLPSEEIKRELIVIKRIEGPFQILISISGLVSNFRK